MCATCGCGDDDARVTHARRARPRTTTQHDHAHGHDHPHHGTATCTSSPTPTIRTHTLELEVAVLAKNDELAARNRAWLAERGITALNLMSSPGVGQDHAAGADHRRARRPRRSP